MKNFIELLFTIFVVLPIALTLGAIPYRIGATGTKAMDFLGWEKLKESLYRDSYLYENTSYKGVAYTLIKGYQDFDIFKFVGYTGGGFVCQTDDYKGRIFIDYKLAEDKDLLEAVLLHEAGHLHYQPEKSKVTCWWLRQWWEIQADYYAYSRSAKNARLILGLIRRMKMTDLLVEHGPRALVLWVVSLFA